MICLLYLAPNHVSVPLSNVYCITDTRNVDDGSEMQSGLAEWTGQRSVPNVFIGGKHIGGCDGIQHLPYLTLPFLCVANLVNSVSRPSTCILQQPLRCMVLESSFRCWLKLEQLPKLIPQEVPKLLSRLPIMLLTCKCYHTLQLIILCYLYLIKNYDCAVLAHVMWTQDLIWSIIKKVQACPLFTYFYVWMR